MPNTLPYAPQRFRASFYESKLKPGRNKGYGVRCSFENGNSRTAVDLSIKKNTVDSLLCPGFSDGGELSRAPIECVGSWWSRLLRLLLFAMLLHYSARSDFLGSLAVAPGASGRFFNVFVLPLFLRTGTSQMTFYCHVYSFC